MVLIRHTPARTGALWKEGCCPPVLLWAPQRNLLAQDLDDEGGTQFPAAQRVPRQHQKGGSGKAKHRRLGSTGYEIGLHFSTNISYFGLLFLLVLKLSPHKQILCNFV